MSNRLRYLLLLVFLTFQYPAWTQSYNNNNPKEGRPLTRILFDFDASQSMYGRWQSDLKINMARSILSKVLDSLSTMENLEVALRVYGHQHHYPPQS